MWKCRHCCPSPISAILVSSAHDHQLCMREGPNTPWRVDSWVFSVYREHWTEHSTWCVNTLYTPPNTPGINSLTQSTPDKIGGGRPSGVGAEGRRNTSGFIGTQFIMVFSYISPPSTKVKVAWAKSDGNQTNLSRFSQSIAIQDGHDAPTITCNNSCSPQQTMGPGFLMETGHKCTICSASSRTPDSQEGSRGWVLIVLSMDSRGWEPRECELFSQSRLTRPALLGAGSRCNRRPRVPIMLWIEIPGPLPVRLGRYSRKSEKGGCAFV